MKISHTVSLAGITIACFILSFAVNIAFLWLCEAAVRHFGMLIPAAAAAVATTVFAIFRVWRS